MTPIVVQVATPAAELLLAALGLTEAVTEPEILLIGIELRELSHGN
jgi:hypothetical protein